MAWNIKFISRLPEGFQDEDLLFLKQLGIEEAYLALPIADHNRKAIRAYKERVENAGIGLHNMHSNLYTFNADIMLGTKERDANIKGYIEYLEMLAEAGIRQIDQTAMPLFVYSSNMTGMTRGCKTRVTDLPTILSSDRPWGQSSWRNPDNQKRLQQLPAYIGRSYTKEELWDNFAYFMQQIKPTLEKYDITVSLHPNDPPCKESVLGIPQLITSLADYKTAFKLADTSHLKISFCCGCWLEGGEQFGNLLKDLEWALQHNLVSMVHLRNISSPLPHFTETFLDNGYFDIYEIFRLLRRYKYEGLINPDHHPEMLDGEIRRCPQSYAFGYMRACVNCADREYDDQEKSHNK